MNDQIVQHVEIFSGRYVPPRGDCVLKPDQFQLDLAMSLGQRGITGMPQLMEQILLDAEMRNRGFHDDLDQGEERGLGGAALSQADKFPDCGKYLQMGAHDFVQLLFRRRAKFADAGNAQRHF